MRVARSTVDQRSDEVVLVANDVGGLGGMERQLGHLVLGLLDAGWRVTVIARTYALGRHQGVRFVRVPGPRRPFTLAFPMFFVVASALAARRGNAILHTTGAIVANRADLSSVHYCHLAAGRMLAAPRARRASRLYRINAAVAARLSRAGEWWCYRPSRTHRLYAVSEGLASELRTYFPPMASRVHTVPNGVDTSEFRPNPEARPRVRAKLGINDQVQLALFAGGDWERKGLRHAVDALASAPDWHLAVAGDGDCGELTARAQESGTECRLHFLGPVEQMAAVYAAADAFVLPTAYETFSLVTYEAAASGLPLLVTRVNGVEDLLQPGRNGWFVNPDAQDIARRLNELAADAIVAQRMAEEARKAAEDCSWDTMTKSYLAAYADLVTHRA
jgi:glycosyltransferase involved in cell wall biosynthesis